MTLDQVERIIRTAAQAGLASGGYVTVEAFLNHPTHSYAALAIFSLTTLASILANIGPKAFRPMATKIEQDATVIGSQLK